MKTPQVSQQEELAFSAIATHALFPGRTTLYVAEVAKALSITEQQVINLIESGDLGAVNISAGMKTFVEGKVPRSHQRIPVSAFDEFVRNRKNQ